MARTKKTIRIEDVLTLANDMLRDSVDKNDKVRAGVSVLLESILHNTGNYNGFKYLTEREMKVSRLGESVGVNSKEDGSFIEDYDERFEGTDESRRMYYSQRLSYFIGR